MSNRLLIIDDDAAVCAFVATVAKSCGFEVGTVTKVDDFYDMVADWRPTHIVLDLHMPDADGVEVLRFLADRRCRARIVVMSGVDQRIIEAARHLGVGSGLDIAAMVQKPVRVQELRRVLDGIGRAADVIDEAALRRAIAAGEFELVYQPKVTLVEPPAPDGRPRTAGFEALLRWRHPQRGVLPPDAFLPLAETLALMDDLTDTVVDQALTQVQAWRDAGFRTTLALNISAANLHAAAFADRLVARVRQAGVAPDAIVIELTETVAMTDPIKAMDILTRLRLKGFRLAIDDFGTGYSSLVQLQRLPFSELKVDRLLVADCATSGQSRMIVKAAIDLAHALGMTACAEGIESAEVLAVVRELGCDLAQGYHIARPMPAAETVAWLRRS
ncbi:EAL domain-containing response regulator [Azospirillum sp. ST 5-10]|uniref:EAL domain-containing response regulator n=1 Tax=unclassified Azospirillum TaxID=2630922 RepID=UPI003F4A1D56